MAKFKCPQCGNENKEKFKGKSLGAGMWCIRCAECGCRAVRFAPVGYKAPTRQVIKWIESEE